MFTVYNKKHQKYYAPFPDENSARRWVRNHLNWQDDISIIKTADIPKVIFVDFRRKAKIPTCWQCGIFLTPVEQQREECLQCFADEDGCHDTNNSGGEEDEVYQN